MSAVWRVLGDPLLPGGDGPLAGETVAVKDLFAVRGHRVGGGVPAFLADAEPAAEHAPAVARLLAAGAAVRGISQTDQFAYSLAGDNPHYGTPTNGAVPGALPGGSSSGSASAVALGEASIGLGTDTGGSIRVPSSYQGLWGIRTTHGAVPTDGVLPLAPRFDTVGVMTRQAGLLARAAAVLLADAPATRAGGLVVAPTSNALTTAAETDAFAAFLERLPAVRDVVLPPTSATGEAYRVHQAWQAWRAHGPWLSTHPGAVLGPVRERFAMAAAITGKQNDAAVAALAVLRAELDAVLGESILVLPSAASVAPRIGADPATIDRARAATLRLTSIAGVTGRPAVSAPLLTVGGAPLGVCLLGPRGSDLALVAAAAALAP